jgi:lipopolysaccharide transport system ATP-binding protein
MKPIVRVEGLGKQYRIGRAKARYSTLREDLMSALQAPWKRLRDRQSEKLETVWALRNIDFEIPLGQTVGLIGRNGAGKSTLLKILSRITEPTSGKARLRGRVGSLLEVGTGFHPELTGRENVFLAGAILGMRRKEIASRFDEIVAFSEVERFLDTPVKHYSSGMYMRLAFAVAAHLETELLLIDEVLAVGDAQFQKKCLGKMEQIGSSGRTVIFVSHNMPAVLRLCNRVILLHQGRVMAIHTRSRLNICARTLAVAQNGSGPTGKRRPGTRWQDSMRSGSSTCEMMSSRRSTSANRFRLKSNTGIYKNICGRLSLFNSRTKMEFVS